MSSPDLYRTAAYCHPALRPCHPALGNGPAGSSAHQRRRRWARLSARLGFPTSPDQLLRLLHQLPLPERPTPRGVGFDEWAWRKRHRYGTILVDLETHQVVDLLPDDQRATITAWLHAHPGIEVISRDRSGPFALAATKGAPQAQQVADRFHLLQNLAQTVQRVFTQHSAQLEAVRTGSAPDSADPSPSAGPSTAADLPSPENTPASENTPVSATGSPGPPTTDPTTRVHRQAQYAEARRLYHLGWRKSAIAAQLGVVPETVRRWVRSATYQARPGGKGRGRPLGSKVDRYETYLRQRWAEGCHNGAILYQELVAQGYTGSYSLLRKWLVDRHVTEPGAPLGPKRRIRYSIPDLVFAVLGRQEARTPEEDQLVKELSSAARPIGRSCDLSREFARMVWEQHAGGLEAWLTAAATSGVAEWERFANGIRRDEAAVQAALTEPWSQGPVEGHIHRLKLVKRAMYGRGSFEVLRKRVLLAA